MTNPESSNPGAAVATPLATVAQILDQYMEYTSKRGRWSSYRTKRSVARGWERAFPWQTIRALEEDDFFDFFCDLLQRRSLDTVKNYRSLIISAVQYHWDKHGIVAAPNPVGRIRLAYKDAVRKIGKSSAPRLPFSREEIQILLDECRADEFTRSFILVAAYTGMRFGEILGMRWEDLDLPSATYMPNVQMGTSCEIRPIKFPRHAPVKLPPQIVELLDKIPRDYEFIFAAGNGGLITRNVLRRRLDRVMERAVKRGVSRKKTFHSLRHFFATEALAAGWDIRDLANQLGHSRVDTTQNTYGHYKPGEINWGFLGD